ncbi:MAG TPA: type II secretion system protein [Blastocatellia bacterium]|nr:type II secretion system protein [Blastocatellia bacterium]
MRVSDREPANKPFQYRQHELGFSLIELMVAIAVITFGLVSIVGISAYVSRANATSNTLSVLATAAQDQADKLRGAIWTVVSVDPRLSIGGNVNYDSSDTNHRTTVTDSPAGTLNVSWKVTAGPGTTADMRTVTIRVVQVNAPARLAEGVTVTLVVPQS